MARGPITFEKEAKEAPALNGKSKSDNFDIVVLNFSDSKIPEFKEIRNKDYIYCGEKNDYPEYLIYQYNKCGKHRAIVNGKSKYILGGGLEGIGGMAPIKDPNDTVTPAAPVNRHKETMYDVLKKSIKDIEIHGGFRWFVTWDMQNRVAEVVQDDFYKFRTGKKEGFYWKDKWFDGAGRPTREEPVYYEEFNGKPPAEGKAKIQVFAYNEYGPATDYYPLPEYVGCANWIDIDIEISKFHLSSLRNGMMPSKMVQFYTGEPTEEKKKEIEKKFKNKFGGSENAGKFVLVFNTNKEKSVDISDLSFNELDKQFDLLNKTSQQEIFTGHQVVSPMLFGIKTEGQLGGNNELRAAYEIFINTYAKPKQDDLLKVINYFGGLMGKGSAYTFLQLDPVGLIFDVKDVLDKLPDDFIFERLGIPKKYRAGLPAATSGAPGVQQQGSDVNDNIKNLTAKQHQQLMRIIRQYNKGQLTKPAAAALLRIGLGLNEDDINYFLEEGEEEPVQMQAFKVAATDETTAIELFSKVGDLRTDFHIVKSKKINFSCDADAIRDELNFYQLCFKQPAITVSEANILDLIGKDKRITPDVIAEAIGSNPEYVTAKIASLVKKGLIKTSEEKIGDDIQIERIVTKPLKDILPPDEGATTTEILIKYSYEVKPNIGPAVIPTTRPFCKKLIELNRLYSRAEIENVSLRLGYSVWDRRGGWWGDDPQCRHIWVSHVVVKKTKGGAV
jgi:hypothetical protein